MTMDAGSIERLRAAQDMVRLLLGNADRGEADMVLVQYAVDNAGAGR